MRRRMLAALGLAWGCRVDTVGELEFDEPAITQLRAVELVPFAERSTPELIRIESMLRRHLGVLAGPHFDGRRPGSDDARQVVNFIVSELTDSGVQPAAPNGGWLQSVPLQVVSSSGELRLRTATELTAVEGVRLARTVDSGPFEVALPLVDVDYGVTAPEWGVDDYAGREITGRAVLARIGVPIGRTEDSSYAGMDYKFERAQRAGARAALVSIEGQRGVSFDALARRFAEPRVFAGARGEPLPTSIDVFGILDAAAAEQLREASTVAGTMVELDVDTEITQWDDANVIGRVAGAQRPEQSVVVVAHWDAGGHAAAAGAGAGAEDNAAGVAIALAMADRAVQWTLAGRRPLRSIVFVLTADGSLGPYGVERYLAGGVADRKNVAAVIVLSGFDLHDSSAHLVAIGAERSSLDVTLTNAFDGGIARELAGTRFDNPEREALDAAGLVTLALTRRSEAGALIDGPFAASTNLKALASTTDSIFDLVWQLADEPGIPVRVEAADDDDKPSEGTAVLARPSDGIDQPP